MPHKVRAQRWNLGKLETLDYFFDSLEEATAFSEQISAHVVKVINHDNEVVSEAITAYNQQPGAGNSPYA